MLPVLRLIAAGHATIPESVPSLVTNFGLSQEEAEILLPSGKQSLIANRAHWARHYMSQAGLVVAQKRGSYVLTEEGRKLLDTDPSTINNSTLNQFSAFRDWRDRSASKRGTTDEASENTEEFPTIPASPSSTPEETIGTAASLLDAALGDDLLRILRDISPVRFERLILDLLSAMGYGGGDLSNTKMTKSTGDGGIDGIIHEDALGLDAVYIQAKRNAPDNKISRPAIQQFVGSLTGEGATKGVFVTISDFSTDARGYLSRVQHRIVLINGQELARLMIRHGVGVRTRTTYLVRGVDEDYFADLNGG